MECWLLTKFENFQSIAFEFFFSKFHQKLFAPNPSNSLLLNGQLNIDFQYLHVFPIFQVFQKLWYIFFKNQPISSGAKCHCIKLPITQELLKILAEFFLVLNLLTFLMPNYQNLFKKCDSIFLKIWKFSKCITFGFSIS